MSYLLALQLGCLSLNLSTSGAVWTVQARLQQIEPVVIIYLVPPSGIVRFMKMILLQQIEPVVIIYLVPLLGIVRYKKDDTAANIATVANLPGATFGHSQVQEG